MMNKILNNGKLHLTADDKATIRDLLIERILAGETPNEILHKGIIFIFSGRIRNESETRYTGVEFLGAKESYIKENIIVDDFTFEDAYDTDGEKVETDLSVSDIAVDYDSDSVSVSWTISHNARERDNIVKLIQPRTNTTKKHREYLRPRISVRTNRIPA